VLRGLRDVVGSAFDFTAREGGAVQVLTLVAVEARPATLGHEQFAAYFEGPATPLLAQGTHAVRHAVLGTFALFIVPIARDARYARYEACVSRKMEA